jgi:translocator protein
LNILKVNGNKNLLALIISILIAEGTGALSAFFNMASIGFFRNLKVSPLTPPDFVFPIVWGILYLLMGIAAYRIWMHGQSGKNINKALILYLIQLLLNFLWPFIFFKLQLFGLAFIELVLLLIFILLTTFEFFTIDKISGLLMIPYVLWVSFAGVLNFSIWLLNEA